MTHWLHTLHWKIVRIEELLISWDSLQLSYFFLIFPSGFRIPVEQWKPVVSCNSQRSWYKNMCTVFVSQICFSVVRRQLDGTTYRAMSRVKSLIWCEKVQWRIQHRTVDEFCMQHLQQLFLRALHIMQGKTSKSRKNVPGTAKIFPFLVQFWSKKVFSDSPLSNPLSLKVLSLVQIFISISQFKWQWTRRVVKDYQFKECVCMTDRHYDDQL